jgi:hypothetical protein
MWYWIHPRDCHSRADCGKYVEPTKVQERAENQATQRFQQVFVLCLIRWKIESRVGNSIKTALDTKGFHSRPDKGARTFLNPSSMGKHGSP